MTAMCGAGGVASAAETIVDGSAGRAPARTVLLGVTGCVAAYKACEIVRLLQKSGVRVKVVMTETATRFVDPQQFRALTREPVAVGLFDDPADPIHHISLAKEADVFAVAPCTANVAAKMAHGIADDLLTTVALACTGRLVVAPAANVNMYEHPATQENLALLRERGVRIVEANAGYLACGDEGRGRLADLADIVRVVLEELAAPAVRRDLAGMNVLVTAGPTIEPIDSVRFISNRSSGKMGYAIARAAARRGADVALVSGPVALAAPAGVRVVHVEEACEMLAAAEEGFDRADVAVFCAAVADMRPANRSDRKLKKSLDDFALAALKLVENPDILATLAARKTSDQIVVGFAAETEDVEARAREKLVRKGADLVVGNRVGEGRAFGADDNEAVLVTAAGTRALPLMSKDALADEVLSAALGLRGNQSA